MSGADYPFTDQTKSLTLIFRATPGKFLCSWFAHTLRLLQNIVS